jgi:hypothetical protein
LIEGYDYKVKGNCLGGTTNKKWPHSGQDIITSGLLN